MFSKEIEECAVMLQSIEERDENYRENKKWQYYRRQQDLMYMAKAKQELLELKMKIERYNKRIVYLEDYLDKNRHLIEENKDERNNI